MNVTALLKANPDLVFKKDHTDGTPLHYAVHWHKRDITELLLAHKADLNAPASDGLQPLHCASAQGYNDVVELLLAHIADVNAKDNDGMTPLHFAADEGHKNVAELLLYNKADVNTRNRDGKTPLQLSGRNDVAELLRRLGDRGIEINETALMTSAYCARRASPLLFNRRPSGLKGRPSTSSGSVWIASWNSFEAFTLGSGVKFGDQSTSVPNKFLPLIFVPLRIFQQRPRR
jgi:hypothetical protein